MVLGKLPVPGRPTILITIGQGPIALAVGAGGGGLDIFLGAPVAQCVKRWPTDLADRVRSSLEVKSSHP